MTTNQPGIDRTVALNVLQTVKSSTEEAKSLIRAASLLILAIDEYGESSKKMLLGGDFDIFAMQKGVELVKVYEARRQDFYVANF